MTAPRAMHETVAAMIAAAQAAGEIAMKYYRAGFDVTIKADETPVTQADREAEQAIKGVLARALPDYGFLGEELGEEGPKDRRFIVDPIDGTKNFIRRIPIWATLIGLEEAGEVTAGVVFNPVSNEMFWARRGDGAWAETERLKVSDVATMAEATLLHADLHLLRQAGYWEQFVRMVDACRRTRGFGDYYGYELVASGKSEVYMETDLKPWDAAPMKILVEEAGGRLTDFYGRPTIYEGSVLATNGRLHDEALALLHRRA
ncbi:MAG TPA: inositol monophosphatase family protein [Methylomirabilota bacterium]|nr:inositol monophosphatase family protein [Methylomirabilota bacterium]